MDRGLRLRAYIWRGRQTNVRGGSCILQPTDITLEQPRTVPPSEHDEGERIPSISSHVLTPSSLSPAAPKNHLSIGPICSPFPPLRCPLFLLSNLGLLVINGSVRQEDPGGADTWMVRVLSRLQEPQEDRGFPSQYNRQQCHYCCCFRFNCARCCSPLRFVHPPFFHSSRPAAAMGHGRPRSRGHHSPNHHCVCC